MTNPRADHWESSELRGQGSPEPSLPPRNTCSNQYRGLSTQYWGLPYLLPPHSSPSDHALMDLAFPCSFSFHSKSRMGMCGRSVGLSEGS